MQIRKEAYKRSRLMVTVFSAEDIFTASVVDPDGANLSGEDNTPIRQSPPAPVGVGPRATG